MKKLNVAIIGQGRSGKAIHGVYFKSDKNVYFNVKYVIEADESRRKLAEQEYPGCIALATYQELFDKKDVDLVVNASYSDMHYSIAKDLLEHKFNVLNEKPFARTRFECDTLIKTAKENGVNIYVFHNTLYAPYYKHALETMKSGVLGEIVQINIYHNNFSRRWDWQTLQKKAGGNAYNTGPHPFGIALGLLDFDEQTRIVYSDLKSTCLSSGDADDYCKVLLRAPNKPLVDLEVNSTDPYCGGMIVKMQGTNGAYKSGVNWFEYKYLAEGKNPPKALIEESLKDADGNPAYCGETLVWEERKGDIEGNAFTVGAPAIYEEIYYNLTEGKPMTTSPEMARKIIEIIETAHAQNPLEMKF
ncbi:MAG: Gfo/Idh/MocA family oxidoreductase [Clostridia bacterium]|nr:Gfo/Idh/MocA family oxidoreductase [Clostridia bacterium]